jgi:hypothetical protein
MTNTRRSGPKVTVGMQITVDPDGSDCPFASEDYWGCSCNAAPEGMKCDGWAGKPVPDECPLLRGAITVAFEPQEPDLSKSCRERGDNFQNCHCCPDLDCCDNDSPAKFQRAADESSKAIEPELSDGSGSVRA